MDSVTSIRHWGHMIGIEVQSMVVRGRGGLGLGFGAGFLVSALEVVCWFWLWPLHGCGSSGIVLLSIHSKPATNAPQQMWLEIYCIATDSFLSF